MCAKPQMDCVAFHWWGEVGGMTVEPLLALPRPG
jgi:hypothetical protein